MLCHRFVMLCPAPSCRGRSKTDRARASRLVFSERHSNCMDHCNTHESVQTPGSSLGNIHLPQMVSRSHEQWCRRHSMPRFPWYVDMLHDQHDLAPCIRSLIESCTRCNWCYFAHMSEVKFQHPARLKAHRNVRCEEPNTCASTHHAVTMTVETSTMERTLQATTQDCIHTVWQGFFRYLAPHVPSPPACSVFSAWPNLAPFLGPTTGTGRTDEGSHAALRVSCCAVRET